MKFPIDPIWKQLIQSKTKQRFCQQSKIAFQAGVRMKGSSSRHHQLAPRNEDGVFPVNTHGTMMKKGLRSAERIGSAGGMEDPDVIMCLSDTWIGVRYLWCNT